MLHFLHFTYEGCLLLLGVSMLSFFKENTLIFSFQNSSHPNSCEVIHFFGEGNGNPLQYCCLENPMDRGAWRSTAYGVAKSQTRLSNFTDFLLGF